MTSYQIPGGIFYPLWCFNWLNRSTGFFVSQWFFGFISKFCLLLQNICLSMACFCGILRLILSLPPLGGGRAVGSPPGPGPTRPRTPRLLLSRDKSRQKRARTIRFWTPSFITGVICFCADPVVRPGYRSAGVVSAAWLLFQDVVLVPTVSRKGNSRDSGN